LDSISYFNVTSSLEIIDTEFRGDQALVKSALLTPPTKTTSRGVEEALAFNLIPTKKCELTEPADLGYHTKLTLKELATSDVTKMQSPTGTKTMKFKCEDDGFMDFNPPP
jgi:hypothetical protein